MAESYASGSLPQERSLDAAVLRCGIAAEPARALLTLGRDVDAYELADRVRLFIRANSSKRVTLTRLEVLTGCTAFQIIKAFRRAVGTTPHAFMIEIRIKDAIDLMRQGVPTAQAAQEVGFVDQSHLIRHFKRYCGTTPTRYLREQRNPSPFELESREAIVSVVVPCHGDRRAETPN